jgi:hypothetical protein
MYTHNYTPPDIVPGTRQLSTGETTEFAGLISRNWGTTDELYAERAQLASAYKQLAYVRWLRNVKLP